MKIVLASASPRREELLRQVGCDFVVQVSDTVEDNDREIPPEDLAVTQARAKAVAVAGLNEPADVVIGADTIVVLDRQVYGKPKDAADAGRMLAALAGRVHTVITGLAVAHQERVWVDSAVTAVRMRPLSGAEIERYIATGEPMDKAGAYAIQGVGSLLVEEISGNYSNVVGLPLTALDRLLRRAAGVGLL